MRRNRRPTTVSFRHSRNRNPTPLFSRGLSRAAARRIASLGADPKVDAVGAAALRRGAAAWIVGGALRDAVLRRDPPEIDVTVSGDVVAIAEEVADAVGSRPVLLSGERSRREGANPIRPRVFRIAGRGRILDVAELEGGTIEADLARRDFTANAIAAALPSLAVLDPHGGLRDLASRHLRILFEANLESDPLRTLRAARLIATHDLAPDRRTSLAVHRFAPGLARVAPERVQAELAKMLEATHTVPALAWAARNGVLGPALGRAALPPRFALSLSSVDRPAIARLPPDRRRRMRLAILSARLGLSPGEAAAWLRRLRWPGEDASAVGRLRDLAAAGAGVRSADGVWEWVLEADELAGDALRLLEALEPRAREHVRRLRARLRRRRTVPEVRGADVLAWTAVSPGPEVGRLLRAVRLAALSGRVRNRAQARAWLQSTARTHPGTD